MIKCMPSFDRALCSVCCRERYWELDSGWLLCSKWCCLHGQDLPGFYQTMAWPLLINTILRGKETASNLRQKLCEQNPFRFSQKREILRGAHAEAAASGSPSLPLSISHLWARGQSSLSAHPFSSSATQLNAKRPVATPSF